MVRFLQIQRVVWSAEAMSESNKDRHPISSRDADPDCGGLMCCCLLAQNSLEGEGAAHLLYVPAVFAEGRSGSLTYLPRFQKEGATRKRAFLLRLKERPTIQENYIL